MALWEEAFDGEHGKEQKSQDDRNVEDQRSVHTFILSTFPNPSSFYPPFFPSLFFAEERMDCLYPIFFEVIVAHLCSLCMYNYPTDSKSP